ncbi:MAG: 1-acyl-sn-glycerol-3-phosphate acyltransferase [Burkholderiaceae bacterium]
MQPVLRFRGAVWARALLRLFGWTVKFNGLPGPKGVIIAYPHTSNWDFVVGILAKWSMGVPLNFWAKEGLFRGISRYTLGPLMRAWGAIEIDRTASQGVIEETIKQIKARDYFWLALSPEGTRKYQDHLKSGFYRVAIGSEVPVGLAYFDFARKTVGLTEFITLTGEEKADLAQIAAYYKDFTGARPDQAGPFRFRELT